MEIVPLKKVFYTRKKKNMKTLKPQKIDAKTQKLVLKSHTVLYNSP